MVQEIANRKARLDAELSKLENEEFMLQMKDGWTIDDFSKMDSIQEKIRSVQLEIEALKEE